MARSNASSEPLTSPPPSPSPPPRSPTPKNPRRRRPSLPDVGFASDSELSELPEEDHESEDEQQKNRALPMYKRRRRGIVPEPMWDWAYKKMAAQHTHASGSGSGSGDTTNRSGAMTRVNSGSAAGDNHTVEDEEEEEEEEEEEAEEEQAVESGEENTDLKDEAVDDPPERENDDPSVPTHSNPIISTTDSKLETDSVVAEDSRIVSAQSSPSPPPSSHSDSSESDPSDDNSIDIEWAINPYPTRQPPDTDSRTRPRHIQLAHDLMLQRKAARENGEHIEEPSQLQQIEDARIFLRRERRKMRSALKESTLGEDTATIEDVGGDDPAPAQESHDVEEPEDGLVDDTPGEPEPAANEDVEAEQEVDDEPPPGDDEQEDEEEDSLEHESDLQPPQRAEALDILAEIEVKFAILRERLYVDKMAELAYEEYLIIRGIHPEVQFLLDTLDNRRARKLTYGSLKRKREEESCLTRYENERQAVWDWWKFERDDLKETMVSETNAKRRRLEREKKSLENRSKVHRPNIPAPVIDPSAPRKAKDILKRYSRPYMSQPHSSSMSSSLNLPSLPSLSMNEVETDLDVLNVARRQPRYYHQLPQPPVQPSAYNSPYSHHSVAYDSSFSQQQQPPPNEYGDGYGSMPPPIMGQGSSHVNSQHHQPPYSHHPRTFPPVPTQMHQSQHHFQQSQPPTQLQIHHPQPQPPLPSPILFSGSANHHYPSPPPSHQTQAHGYGHGLPAPSINGILWDETTHRDDHRHPPPDTPGENGEWMGRSYHYSHPRSSTHDSLMNQERERERHRASTSATHTPPDRPVVTPFILPPPNGIHTLPSEPPPDFGNHSNGPWEGSLPLPPPPAPPQHHYDRPQFAPPPAHNSSPRLPSRPQSAHERSHPHSPVVLTRPPSAHTPHPPSHPVRAEPIILTAEPPSHTSPIASRTSPATTTNPTPTFNSPQRQFASHAFANKLFPPISRSGTISPAPSTSASNPLGPATSGPPQSHTPMPVKVE